MVKIDVLRTHGYLFCHIQTNANIVGELYQFCGGLIVQYREGKVTALESNVLKDLGEGII